MEQPKLEILPSILEDPHLLLPQIRQFVEQCLKVLEAGGEVNLIGLDAQVQTLCGHIAAMELKEAESIRPRMQSLIAELDQLAGALGKQRAEVAEQLNDLTRQHQALTAYKKVDASVPYRPEEEQ